MTDNPKDVFDQQAMFDAAVARLEKEGRDKVYCAAPSEPVSKREAVPVKKPTKREEPALLKPKPPLCGVEPYVVWTTPDDTIVPVEELPPDLATFCNLWTQGKLRRSFRLKLTGGSWEDIGVWLQCVGSDGPEQKLAATMLTDQFLDCLTWFDSHGLVQNLLAEVEVLPWKIAKLPLPREDMTSVAMDSTGPFVLNNQRYIYPPNHTWDGKVIGDPSHYFDHTNWESLFTLVVSAIFDLRADDSTNVARLLKQATETTNQVVGVEHMSSIDVVSMCRELLWTHGLNVEKVVLSSDRLATCWLKMPPSTQRFLKGNGRVCGCSVLCYGPPAFDIFSALELGSLLLPAHQSVLGVRYTREKPTFHSLDGRPMGEEWVGIYGYQRVATVVANAHAVAGVINPASVKERS
jgi:hypothetical protein